ncbi:MAG: efflux RND transporter periplasmic adaptor subunit [Myxococcales bacterium]|nr:efflux RND transporter periplasmic adaptor subunit [Myxococcales bacterium]
MSQGASTAGDRSLQIPELASRGRRLKYFFAALALLAAAAFYWQQTRPAPQAELFRYDRIETRTLVQRVEAAGSIDVRSRVEVPAPVPGRLMQILVEPRAQVEEGQLLAELDPGSAQVQVEGARAQVQAASGRVTQARAALQVARDAHARATQLHAKGLASGQQLDQAEAEVKQAEAALSAARAQQKVADQGVASAEHGKSLGHIVAPRAGVVLTAPDRLGAAVSPQQGPLFVIGEPLEKMRIEASVSETEIAQVKLGQAAEVEVQALPGRSFSAQVERIAIEPERRAGVVLYPVRLLVDNPEGVLLPGMSARVRMEVARAEGVLSAHEAALRFAPAEAEAAATPRSRVFKQLGTAELEEVPVEAGISDGVYTELRATGGAALEVGDGLAIGLLRPDAAGGKPRVSLGGGK